MAENFVDYSVRGVLADNLFFLFNSVLSAATTGLVARAAELKQQPDVEAYLLGSRNPCLERPYIKDYVISGICTGGQGGRMENQATEILWKLER